MLSRNKLPQKGRTNNFSLMLLSFLVVAIFFIPNVNAVEFDNVETYSEDGLSIEVDNWYGVGATIGAATVMTGLDNHVTRGYNEIQRIKMNGYEDYEDALKNFKYIDKRTNEEILREVDIKIVTTEQEEIFDYYYNCYEVYNETNSSYNTECDKIENGSHFEPKEIFTDIGDVVDIKENEELIISLWTEVLAGDKIDLIAEIYGEEIEGWAIWTEDMNVDIKAYYRLDEASGNAVDATGTQSDGTSTGITYGNSGIIVDSFDFTGGGGTANVDLNFVPSATSFTTNTWVYFTSSPSSTTHRLYDSIATAGDGIEIFFSGGVSTARMGYGGGLSSVVGTYDFDGHEDEWHMITTTFNTINNNLTIYIDGDYDNSGITSGDVSWGTQDIILGNNDALSREFPGRLDEHSFWGRVLTFSEINETLWNGGAGNTYTDSFGSNPSVTLTSPTDNANLTSATVDHIATVTDAIYVENVTLYLDGVANETKTTHVNGSYTFTKTVLQGVHNWSILAWNNNSGSNQSATWEYNLTIPPINIDLLSPADSSTQETPTVNMSCEAYKEEGVTQLNLSINGVTNISITNTTIAENLTISQEVNFNEGNYTWGCSAINPSTSAISNNRTFEVLYSNPVISLGLPVDTANLTSNSVNFSFNATDLNGISNVTLYLDGVLNETNNSGVNGSYIFIKNILDGVHNWTVVSESIYGKSTTSVTRDFNIDALPPIINLTAPPELFDYLINGEILNLNWTVSDPNLDSCWHDYYNDNVSFTDYSSLPSSLFDNNLTTTTETFTGSMLVLSDVNEIIFASARVGALCPSPVVPTFNVMNISSCSTYDNNKNITMNTTSSGSTTYQQFFCDGNLLLNKTYIGLGICFDKPSEIFVNKTNLDCNANTTTFNYIQGKNNITFYSNDTYGNIGNATRSWASLIGTFSIDYENPVYEGYENTITATIEELAAGSLLTSAILYYNGVNYTTSINYSAGDYIVSSELAAPPVTSDTNYTFGFYLTIDGSVYDPQSNNQTVLNANFGECGGISNDTILTLNLVNEDTQVSILGDIEVSGTIKSVSSDETIGVIYTNFTNSSNASLCFSPPSAYSLYYMDAEIRYTSDGYSSELYYLQKADITEDLGNLTLYDLNETKSTRFKVTYQDSTYNFVEGAVVQLQRKYISEGVYKTVEAPLTSNEGVSILHINLDSIGYRATVVKDGAVLDEFNNLVFNCQSELTGECEHKLLGTIDSDNEENLDNTRDFSYSEPVLSNDSISVSFSIPSGSPASVIIVLEQKDQFSNETLCNTTIISSAGSMSCDYSEALGESYIDFTIYKDGEAIGKKSYVVRAGDYLDWLGNNYIFIFILLISLVGMALTSPEWIVINGILTMVISGGLYLARGLDFVVGLGSIVWLVIAAIILISKMGKQEDR